MLKTHCEHPGAIKPCFMTKGAACADVYLPEAVVIPAKSVVKVPTGLSFDIPEGFKIVMYPRSSLLVKRKLIQPVSIIDEDYHGIVHVPLYNPTDEDIVLEVGERVAQIEMVPTGYKSITDWFNADNKRDQNGFGGTGK